MSATADGTAEVWVRRSRVEYPFIAVFGVLMAFGLALLFAIGGSAWVDQLSLSLFTGAGAGFFLATTRTRIDVYPDHIYLVNLWRRIHIDRAAIGELLTASGIVVVLTDRQQVVVTVFPPALAKRFIGNRRGRAFGAAMAERLQVPSNVPWPNSTPVPNGSVRSSFRWDVPGFAVGTALVVVLVGVAARLIAG
jgi:hypothetical protein